MIDLIEKRSRLRTTDCFYNNKITGTTFHLIEDGDWKLELIFFGSNEWRDWIRNLYQIIFIGLSIWLFTVNRVAGAVCLHISMTVHFGFFLGGIECLLVLFKKYGFKLFSKNIRAFGHEGRRIVTGKQPNR